MLKSLKITGFGLWAIASAAFVLSACGTKIAGGVDEETNTVASDIPKDTVPVHIIDTLSTKDTVRIIDSVVTPVPSQQTNKDVVIVGDSDTLIMHTIVKCSISGDAEKSYELSLATKDSVLYVKTNEQGFFELQDLPNGIYPLTVENLGEGFASNVGYILQYESFKATILGPVPTSVLSSVTADELIAPPLQTVDVPDVAGTQPKDSSAIGAPDPICDSSNTPLPVPSGYVYGAGNGQNSGIKLQLPYEYDYGLVYHWNETNIPTNGDSANDNLVYAQELEAVTVEVTFIINSLSEDFSYNRNIFGKTGLFNLALVKIKCWEQKPALTFFIGNGYERTECHDKAVVSSAELEVGKEITVTATWIGGSIKLYMNGFLIAQQQRQSISSEITISDVLETPFIFGDKDLDITIKDVRLGNKAINPADVLYRYYLKGGDQ